jgi:hypothetical protein
MQDSNELLIEEPQPGERLLATVAANGPQVTNNSHTATMRLRLCRRIDPDAAMAV